MSEGPGHQGNFSSFNQPPKSSSKWLFWLVGAIALIGVTGACCIFVGPALLLPAVQQIRDASRQTVAMGNAKQIAMAIGNYQDAHKRYPSADSIRTQQGTTKHSWRMQILPFMELSQVYESIDVSQSWNADANHAAYQEVDVNLFETPSGENTGSIAHFVAVVDDDTIISNSQKVSPQMVRDGISKTIMIIEYRESDIEWYRPQDININEAIRIIQQQKTSQGTIVIFGDGSIGRIPRTISAEDLRGMFTRNGGEITPSEYLPARE